MGAFDDQLDYNCVIFDIDGTLADCSHRRHHVANKPKNWAAFNATMCDDVPDHRIVRLARLMNTSGYKVVLCTGREEVYRDVTVAWLRKHIIPHAALYMRGEKDYRGDDIIKSELLDKILADRWLPWLV